MLLPLNINKEEPDGSENDELIDVIDVTYNAPLIVCEPLNTFEPVVAYELVFEFTLALNVFKFVIDVTKLAVEILAVYELKDDVVTNEPVSIVVDELINPNAVICAEPLIVPDGTALTLPLNVYLVSKEDVSWEEPLITPAAPPALFNLLFTDALNATTSPIPKTEPVSEPVIEPLEST